MKKLLLSLLLLTTPAYAQVRDDTGATGTFTPDRSASGALGALEAAVTINVSGRQAVGGYVTTGTLSGTLTPEVTIDGTNWIATSVYALSAGATPTRVASVTLNTLFGIELPPGAKQARVRVSAYTSGSSTGTLIATETAGVAVFQPTQPISGTVTANAGSGTFTVGDGSGALTVDGTVTANAGSGTFTVGDGAGALNVIVDSGSITASDPTFTDATGTAVPANAAFVGGTDGTNTRALKTDVGGELQVDVLSATATDFDIRNLTAANDTVQVGDGVETATVRDTGTSDSLNVAIVDAAGAQITSFGGGTEYTEDAAAPADPVAGANMLVRDDTPNGQVTTDGDFVAQRGTNFGAGYVQIVTSAGAFVDTFGGAGGTAQADRSAFTDGTTNFTPVGGTFNETNTNPTEDQAAAARITSERALHTNLRDHTVDRGAGVTAANELNVIATAQPGVDIGDVTVNNAGGGAAVNIQDGGNSITVDGTVGVTGTVTANQGTAAATTASWPVSSGNVAATTAAWTSATPDETTLTLAVTGYSTVVLSLNATSTMTAGQIEFEGNDGGSIWFARQGLRSGTTTLETFLALSVTDQLWQFNVAGLSQFRVRLSTVITGTGTANLRLQASAAVLAPYQTVQGAVTANAGTGTFTVGDGAGALNTIVDSGTITANAGTGIFTVGDGAGALNVIVDSGTTTVTATDLDVRNLNATDDIVQARGAAADGAAVTGNPVLIAGQDGTNAQTVKTDTTGSVQVDIESAPTLTVAVSQTTTDNDVDVVSLPNEGQQTAANSTSVTPDTDNDAIGAPAAAVPGEAIQVAGTDGTNLTVPYIDPCEREARTVFRVDIVTATTTEIAAAVASEFYWICSINLITAGGNNVIIVEDDTATNCPSPTAGVSSGGTTAAEGWNFGANGGIVTGTGSNWVMKTGTANRSFCIITSAAVQLSGTITFVSAP